MYKISGEHTTHGHLVYCPSTLGWSFYADRPLFFRRVQGLATVRAPRSWQQKNGNKNIEDGGDTQFFFHEFVWSFFRMMWPKNSKTRFLDLRLVKKSSSDILYASKPWFPQGIGSAWNHSVATHGAPTGDSESSGSEPLDVLGMEEDQEDQEDEEGEEFEEDQTGEMKDWHLETFRNNTWSVVVCICLILTSLYIYMFKYVLHIYIIIFIFQKTSYLYMNIYCI